jgi:diguanylate cyclase (GGDEF)-like protein/PAS domain S-box-containing protein
MKTSVSWLEASYGAQCDHRHGEAPETAEHNDITVLVVDDERRMRQSVRDLLMAYGYTCLLADNGQKALQILEEKMVDLLLLDLNMPEMNGYQVMQQVKRSHPNTDVIVVSGETTFESAAEALRQGAQDFLRKPYAPDELSRVVGNVVHKRRLEQNLHEVNRRLEASEHRYRFIVNNSPDIIYMLDDKGCFTFINEQVTALLGYQPEEVVGMHYSELVHEEDREKACFAFDERRTGNRASQNVEFRLLCKDNPSSYRYFESRSIAIELSTVGVYRNESTEQGVSFTGTYGVARDISERKQAEEIINYQLYHDLLTKLPNRALFRDRLSLAISQAQRNGSKLAVMFLDMDRFKMVNDSLGHLAGDQLLQTVAARLNDCLRDSDTLARVGGDEFNLLVPDIDGSEDAAMIAHNIMDKLKEPVVLEEYEVFVSFSIGIALFPDDGQKMDALVKHADMAMYHIKGRGKNGYEFFSDHMKMHYHRQLSLESGIRKALEENQFELFFQPQVDVCNERVCGMEALIRWNHPERGLVLPGEFIPLSEETGLIISIGSWVLERACREIAAWRREGADAVVMAVNISAAQLEQPGFEQQVIDTMNRYQVKRGQLELEITENVLMQDMDQAVTKFQNLASHGVRVAVDDFGIGYSCLSYLNSLPLNTLKIDRSFISDICSPRDKNSIVTAIFAMARELDLEVVAEGVESRVQLDYLKKLHCHKAQGYLLGRPMQSRPAMDLLKRNVVQRKYRRSLVESG